ncbi:dephospho-CoA kinase [Sphingobacterium alimentarium]|uniref:Dephospho-CoA kinase n=1 Tax=Sphingobacterium alimentarium TaxID=797292 RepID=A0A4R3VYZ2_9SPHI|nr:dephospho-CoA kinase [Sphingobacterium alimentarium]TCV16587.1 dephospho-CoA kinase [Sphingobacterium alimentarium]
MKSLKVGITGGIGSGKSFVSKIFKTLGVPFYDADKEAKAIMNSSDTVRKGLIDAFGESVYFADGTLNRKWLAEQVFNNNDQLTILNGIVHPVVIQHAVDWANVQRSCYSLKEAALLFESGSYKTLDYTILVIAPQNVRIDRVMARDNVSREEVINRINKQMSDEAKMEMAHFILVNDGIEPLLPQIYNIHKQLIDKC